MPRRDRVAAVERRVLRARGAAPVRHPARPAALPAAARRSRGCGWARRCSRCSASRATARRTSGSPRAPGSSAGWGARRGTRCGGRCCAGKFGERADDIAMVWLWSKLRLRRSSAARTCAQERLGYPRDVVGGAVRARWRGRSTDGGRPRADRPPGGAGRARRRRGFRVIAGAPRLVPARATTRARSRRPATRAYDRVLATVPNDVFAAAARPGAGRRGGRAATSTRARGDRVLRRALPAARARPPVQPVLLDQRGRPRAPVRRADRAHELRRAGALRRPPLPLRRQLPAARPRAARARRRRAARRYEAGLRAVNPALRARLGAARVAVRRAGRAADRHGRLRGPDPAAAHARRRASCSPTRRRSIPRTAGRTTPCGWARRRRPR